MKGFSKKGSIAIYSKNEYNESSFCLHMLPLKHLIKGWFWCTVMIDFLLHCRWKKIGLTKYPRVIMYKGLSPRFLVVGKILCRRGIKQLGISFGDIFHLFSSTCKNNWGTCSCIVGKIAYHVHQLPRYHVHIRDLCCAVWSKHIHQRTDKGWTFHPVELKIACGLVFKDYQFTINVIIFNSNH